MRNFRLKLKSTTFRRLPLVGLPFIIYTRRSLGSVSGSTRHAATAGSAEPGSYGWASADCTVLDDFARAISQRWFG